MLAVEINMYSSGRLMKKGHTNSYYNRLHEANDYQRKLKEKKGTLERMNQVDIEGEMYKLITSLHVNA